MIKSVLGVGNNKEDIRLCIEEAVREFDSPKLIFFFCGEQEFPEVARILHIRFPEALSIGCSAYRTWNRYGSQNDVLSVMAIEEGIVCAGGSLPHIVDTDELIQTGSEQVRACVEAVGDTENTICVEFTIPFLQGEENTLAALNSVLLEKEIPVIGGTAANIAAGTGESEEAYIALNGEVYREGSVYAVIHNLEGGISLYRENIYEPLTGREFEVTKALGTERRIVTCDDKPALEVYADELGIDKARASEFYFHYPMGRRSGEDTYVTAIQEAEQDGSLKFFARAEEGEKMMVMKEGDYQEITKDTIARVLEKTENPPCVLMFHCVARTVLFEQNCYIDEYQELLAEAFPNLIGFACLGEQYGGKHFNHTMMLAVFE